MKNASGTQLATTKRSELGAFIDSRLILKALSNVWQKKIKKKSRKGKGAKRLIGARVRRE